MSGREELPTRRRSEVREFHHNGQRYSLGVSCFPGTRRIAEIFLANSKPGSESEAIARDGAILASLALQHGVSLNVLKHAITRSADGSAATAIGHALDLLAAVNLDEARHDRAYRRNCPHCDLCPRTLVVGQMKPWCQSKQDMTMDIERARIEVCKLLEQPDGSFNLTLGDLGLASAIRIIAESAEKRIELGEDADTALSVAVDMFEGYLELGEERRNEPFAFAEWMAKTCLPRIRLPDGAFVKNPEAVHLL